MKHILILLFTFFSVQAHSQLYKANKGWRVCFAEINNDSAHIEIYYNSPPDFIVKSFDAVIPLNDTDLNKPVELNVRKDNYILKVRKHNGKRFEKMHLKSCDSVDRTNFRNKSYSSYKRIQMMKLQDSLSGPDTLIRLDVNNIYREVNANVAEKVYTERVDEITDSLTAIIYHFKNSSIDLYYQKADSITKLDTIEINNLLSNSNYELYYSNYLLYKIALDRPEILIGYIDTKPLNEKLVLRKIRNHNNFKEITKNVKEAELSTKGKKKIVKQKSKRIITDIVVGAAYITIILVELAALTAFGIWIF